MESQTLLASVRDATSEAQARAIITSFCAKYMADGILAGEPSPLTADGNSAARVVGQAARIYADNFMPTAHSRYVSSDTVLSALGIARQRSTLAGG